VSVYARLLVAVGSKRWFAYVASRVAPRLDRIVYRLTGKRRLATPVSVPTLFLTTVGRQSGRGHTVALSYLENGADFVVVGTNWGKKATPEWALNLIANPRAVLEVAGERLQVEAELVPPEDSESLWMGFRAMWPPYEAYRQRIEGRTIHMFRLVGL
jgi:deazaflavin-dependent oxidoreductase (nitroreductase family)